LPRHRLRPQSGVSSTYSARSPNLSTIPPPSAGVEGIVGGGKGLSSRRRRLHPIPKLAQHISLRLQSAD
jgi:hypothetical protein